MLTIFTTPKASIGEIARLQRNALLSWTLLTPSPEIIVFGAEAGTERLCSELGLRHFPHVRLNRSGTPLINEMFRSARECSRSEILCYLNADIILMDPFMQAVGAAESLGRDFLMVGRRCTVRVDRWIDFTQDWAALLREEARTEGVVDNDYFIDYFVFSRDLFGAIPPFAVGRAAYDNWLIWRALRKRAVVLDASEAVLAVHQLHGYQHVRGGKQTVYEGTEAQENLALAQGRRRLRSISDATHALTPDLEIRKARGGKYAKARIERRLAAVRGNPLFRLTQPARHSLGLRRSSWDALVRRWERFRR